MLKYFKITVCCVSVCGRIQFRNGSKITASQLSEALFASYTSLFCLLFFSAHLDRNMSLTKVQKEKYQVVINFQASTILFSTGKSLSEALIFASTNPQYDNRLFIELHVQYMKMPRSNLRRTCCEQKLFLTFRTIFVHNMFSPCLSLEFSCIELVIQ